MEFHTDLIFWHISCDISSPNKCKMIFFCSRDLVAFYTFLKFVLYIKLKQERRNKHISWVELSMHKITVLCLRRLLNGLTSHDCQLFMVLRLSLHLWVNMTMFSLCSWCRQLFLLFMSFSLAVEGLHAFIQDESEHK